MCSLLASLGLALAASACGASNLGSKVAKAPEFEPEGQAKCKVSASQSKPLIVEWPSADRTDLEARSRQGGLVVVGYEGCEMRLLPRCHAPGGYAYIPVTTKHDTISITNEDELYANVPMGAAKLESKLASSGQLNVAMTLVGKFSADRADVTLDELEGSCDGATHVVLGMSVGAFEFFAGAAGEVGAGVDVMGAGVGASSKGGKETLTRDGDTKACQEASVDDESPPSGCGASLRLEVAEIAPPAKDEGEELVDNGELNCPPGTELVDGACQPKVSTQCPPGMQFKHGQGCIPDVVKIPTKVQAHADVPSRGPERAPVLIQWFGGYQDPFTKRASQTIAQVEKAHPGQVRIEFRQAPLSFHQHARPAAYAALEAFAQQGELGFWKMHEALLARSPNLVPAELEAAAEEVGLDLARFRAALKNQVHKEQVDEDFAAFNARGFRGTPSFLVGRDIVVGAQPFETFDEAVKRVLAGEDGKVENAPPQIRARRAEDRERAVLAVPPGAPTLGPANAPVTIHWFGSYQEPFTAKVAPDMKRLITAFPREVRIVWRHFTLPHHEQARPAANLAMLAQASGKFWDMHDLLIENRGALEDADLKKYGARLGLDPVAVDRAITQEPLDDTIEADAKAAKEAGARGVPTIFINGKKVGGAIPFDALEREVRAALDASR